MSKLSISIKPKFKRIAEIAGYEDYVNYDVYTDGRIYSRKSNRFLKGTINGDGYICSELNGYTKVVHRLVSLAFIPNPDNLPCVDHINGIRDDNRVANLRWACYLGNSQNRGMSKTNTSGEECISRHKRERYGYITVYWKVAVCANRHAYEELYPIGKLPLDASQADIDALYASKPITAEMRLARDNLKIQHHGEFASIHSRD
jgi:hypothetical protein